MYETHDPNRPASASEVAWSTSEHEAPLSDASTLPDSGITAPAAVDLVEDAAHSAHDTVDRIADSAQPAARQIDESVAAAGQVLHEKTDQWRETRDEWDEWAEGVRSSVRSNPLASIAAALALGAVVARLTR